MKIGIKAKQARLRELQKALGKNDSGMAELIGCTRKTYSSAANGDNVSAGFMAKFSVAFGTNYDHYFETVKPELAAA